MNLHTIKKNLSGIYNTIKEKIINPVAVGINKAKKTRSSDLVDFMKWALGFIDGQGDLGYQDGLKNQGGSKEALKEGIDAINAEVDFMASVIIEPLEEELINCKSDQREVNEALNVSSRERKERFGDLLNIAIIPLKNGTDFIAVKPIEAKIQYLKGIVEDIALAKDRSLKAMNGFVPTNKTLKKVLPYLGAALTLIIGGGEYVATKDLFRLMGFGELSVTFLTCVVALVLAVTSVLAGRFQFEKDLPKLRLSMGIAGITIVGLLVFRLFEGEQFYLSVLPALFWAVGYLISTITTPLSRYFELDEMEEKKRLEYAEHLQSKSRAIKHNRQVEKTQAEYKRSKTKLGVQAEEQVLKSRGKELQGQIEKLTARLESAKSKCDKVKVQATYIYKKNFKRGQSENRRLFSFGKGAATILLLCMAFTTMSCDAVEKHLAPDHKIVTICIDLTQKPENRNELNPKAIIDFVFSEVIKVDDSGMVRDKIEIVFRSINSVYLGTPEAYVLKGANLDVNIYDRETEVSEFRAALVQKLSNTIPTGPELKHTKLFQVISQSIIHMEQSDAAQNALLLFTDAVHHDNVVSMFNITPEQVLEQSGQWETELLTDSPLPDSIKNLDVYFIYTPNPQNQFKVKAASGFFKSLLEKRGAHVFTLGNIK